MSLTTRRAALAAYLVLSTCLWVGCTSTGTTPETGTATVSDKVDPKEVPYADPAARAQGAQAAARVEKAFSFGGDESARPMLDQAVGGGSLSPAALVGMGAALRNSTTPTYASVPLERAVSLDPGSSTARDELAQAYAAAEKWGRAADAQHAANQRSLYKAPEGFRRLLAYLALYLDREGFTDAARELSRDPAARAAGVPAFEALAASLGGRHFSWGLDIGPHASGGIAVTRVDPGSVAEIAGLRVGDRLDRIGGEQVRDRYHAEELLLRDPVGSAVALVVRRPEGLESLTAQKRIDAARWTAAELNAKGTESAGRGELDEALVLFTRASRLDPSLGKSWYNIGLVHDMRGEVAPALSGYLGGLALGLDPELTPQVTARAGELVRAQDRGLENAFPGGVRELAATGERDAKNGRYVRALAAYLRALAHAPGYPRALLGAGTLEAALGVRSAALRHLRSYLTVRPGAGNRGQVEEKIAGLERLGPVGT